MTKRKSSTAKTVATQPFNASHIAVIQAVVDASVHESEPVASEPHKKISRWGLYQFHFQDGTRLRHLVGWGGNEGRVSTAVEVLNLESMTATTESGRVYAMVGPPGWDSDATYVMGVWMRVNSVLRHKNMTKALMRRRAAVVVGEATANAKCPVPSAQRE
ncbi:MAG: hypothetical protein ABIZ09_06600 [Rhodoferax sp.]